MALHLQHQQQKQRGKKKKTTTVESLGKNLVHHSTPQMLNGPLLNINGKGISSPSCNEQ